MVWRHESSRNLPAQPPAWYRNLIACMDDKLRIDVASKDGQPVASMGPRFIEKACDEKCPTRQSGKRSV